MKCWQFSSSTWLNFELINSILCLLSVNRVAVGLHNVSFATTFVSVSVRYSDIDSHNGKERSAKALPLTAVLSLLDV